MTTVTTEPRLHPNASHNDEQKKLATEYKKLVEDAFEKLPNNGAFLFAHASSILRQVAEEFYG